MSARQFVFTFNNYNDRNIREACEHWEEFFTYLGWGDEIAPSTGTPHLQGLVRHKSKVRLRQCVRDLQDCFGCEDGQHIHVEVGRGTFAQAKAYCEKGGRFVCYGTEPRQGKRTDISRVAEKLAAGESIAEAARDHPSVFIKYSRGLQAFAQLYQKRRDFKTRVIWCYGPTGTGKSKWIVEQAPEAYWKSGRNKWWDGYANEDCVVIDDFRPSAEMPLDYLLRLFDRYPFQVECKGGTLTFNSKTIYVSAPWRPEELYSKLPFEIPGEDIAQLVRRIEEFRNFPDVSDIFPGSPRSIIELID